jgi:hypothetical protein
VFCVLCFVFCVLCFVFCVLCFVSCVLCLVSCVLLFVICDVCFCATLRSCNVHFAVFPVLPMRAFLFHVSCCFMLFHVSCCFMFVTMNKIEFTNASVSFMHIGFGLHVMFGTLQRVNMTLCVCVCCCCVHACISAVSFGVHTLILCSLACLCHV